MTARAATIKSIRIVHEEEGEALEILSTRPLIPSIQEVRNPDRLVIDLPNARVGGQPKKVEVNADQIGAIHAGLVEDTPPITRVIVDLAAPRTYTWDAAGNRLVVHLGKSAAEMGQEYRPPTEASLKAEPEGAIAGIRAAGPLTIAATKNDVGGSGSSVTAGTETAIMTLSSGGEVRVCPGTTVSVTPSENRHNLLLSMDAGAMETHLALDATSDTVMTPDFRIQLMGPGIFHYAISADRRGDTCVRALAGNTASAIVSELMDDRTYQVKATDQLVFRGGRLDRVDMDVPLECGCPPEREAPLRAMNNLPVGSAAGRTNAAKVAGANGGGGDEARAKSTASSGDSSLAASGRPNELQVQIEAPLVFHADGPRPAPVHDVSALPANSRAGATPVTVNATPPATNASAATGDQAAGRPAQRGFFRRIGGFFASLFR